MKIGLLSDAHFEFRKYVLNGLPPLSSECDVFILGGDIGNRKGAIEAVQRIANAVPHTQILFVAGNHEFYKSSIDSQLVKFREAFEGDSQIHFLENDTVSINDVRFLGCTLCCGFDVMGKDHVRPSMEEARRYIADFRLIRNHMGSKPFRPMDAVVKYRESRAWLAQELQKETNEKTVVRTHFPPVREARHENIAEGLLTY